MTRVIIFISLMSAYLILPAQKKKEIKKHGIKTIIVTENLGGKSITDSKTTYNLSGLPVEEINYDKNGVLKRITKYKYNALGDVTEEMEYDEKNNLKEKRTYKYNALEEKTEELVTDSGGKQIKRTVYTYDARGFRIGKQIYDAGNKLIASKKMVYSK